MSCNTTQAPRRDPSRIAVFSSISQDRDENHNKVDQFKLARWCRVCNLFEKKSDRCRVAFDFPPNDLIHTARQLSCPFCSIVLDAIQEFAPEIGDLQTTVAWIYARGPAEILPHTLSFEIYFRDERRKLELELYARTSTGQHLSKDVITAKAQAFQRHESLSDYSLAWVQKQISACVDGHAQCPVPSENPILPKRILSFRQGPDGFMCVKLVETEGATGRYACLSHRWGGSDSGMATRKTYPDLLNGIPWELLPRTFQDVIGLAWALDIERLWIDSFCIIQDDLGDWREQAGRMADIYQNAFVTLAVATAPNNHSGCFWGSNEQYERNFTSTAGPLTVRKKTQHWVRCWTSNHAQIFPLLTRAWVFQERLLSPRVLYLSDNEFVWECLQHGGCQCGGYSPLSNPKSENWTRSKSWRQAIELYTSLQLTRETDRLTALLGFARYFGQFNGMSLDEDYLAGLWRSSLHTDLLWRVDSSALSFGDSEKRLCRCFDTMNVDSEMEKLRLCQYSFSAACSTGCLIQRRLCRYGASDAAVEYLTEFRGSCCGLDEPATTIEGLSRLYKSTELCYSELKDSRPEPTWSWISAQTPVQFWHNVQHIPRDPEAPRDFLTPCTICTVQIDNSHVSPPEAARQSVLTVDGWVAFGLLEYRFQPDPSAERETRNTHSLFRYGIRCGNVVQRTLEFYPDYILSLEGQWCVPDGSPLFLLHVTSGVYLVLKEKWYLDLSWSEKLFIATNGASAARASMKGFLRDSSPKFVRVGILVTIHVRRDATFLPVDWLKKVEIY